MHAHIYIIALKLQYFNRKCFEPTKTYQKCICKIPKNLRGERIKLRLRHSDVIPIGIVMYCDKEQSDVMRSAFLTREAHITDEVNITPEGRAHIVKKSTLSRAFFCLKSDKRCLNTGKNEQKVSNPQNTDQSFLFFLLFIILTRTIMNKVTDIKSSGPPVQT